jgi:hypothetical protein
MSFFTNDTSIPNTISSLKIKNKKKQTKDQNKNRQTKKTKDQNKNKQTKKTKDQNKNKQTKKTKDQNILNIYEDNMLDFNYRINNIRMGSLAPDNIDKVYFTPSRIYTIR